MPPPGPHRRARAPRDAGTSQRERRLRRLAVLVRARPRGARDAAPVRVRRLGHACRGAAARERRRACCPQAPPQPEIVAGLGTLHLQLPVTQSRVTAIGYQGGSDGSLALAPLGSQANQGLLQRVGHSIFGGSSGGRAGTSCRAVRARPRRRSTSALRAGTDVYAPVDGTSSSIGDVVLNGRNYGARIDIQPTGAPSLVVSVSHVTVDPALVVGSPSTAGGSKLGSSSTSRSAERQSLAHYTNDSGNHVVVEVHPAATLSLG